MITLVQKMYYSVKQAVCEAWKLYFDKCGKCPSKRYQFKALTYTKANETKLYIQYGLVFPRHINNLLAQSTSTHSIFLFQYYESGRKSNIF
jgi:hypothetical protein